MIVPAMTFAQADSPTPFPGLTGELDPLSRTVQLAAVVSVRGDLTGMQVDDWANLVVPNSGLPQQTTLQRLCAAGAAIAVGSGPAH